MRSGGGGGAHRLYVYVVLSKEASGCTGLVQGLDVVPGLLGTSLRQSILHAQ